MIEKTVPPTGRVELSERSNTESSPEGFQCPACRWHEGEDPAEWFAEEVKLRASPAAVVDYTERARACIDRYQLPNDKLWHEAVERVAAALSALASEHQAAHREKLAAVMLRHSIATGHGDTFDDLLAELEKAFTDDLTEALRDNLKAALLARLREPGVREALSTELRPYLHDMTLEARDTVLTAALARIEEMLTP